MPRHLDAAKSGRALAIAVALLAATTAMSPLAQARPAGAVQPRQDFNGDGYEDLAVGAPHGTVDGVAQAGYVAVLYGSASGTSTSTKKIYSQATAGIPGSPEKGDEFGYDLDTADLDGDGYTDLVVLTAEEEWTSGGKERLASRTVLWGGPEGLTSATTLPAAGAGTYQDGPFATGDFDGDGQADLIREGLLETGPFGRDGVPVTSETVLTGPANEIVTDLAAGDADGDGSTDLVARVTVYDQGEEEGSYQELHYLRGGDDPLTSATVLANGDGDPANATGSALTLGDVDGDGRADLLLGYQNIRISYGTANGPDTAHTQLIDQDTPGVPGTQEPEDTFGSELTVGDVNGDGYGDILAGNAAEGVGTVQPSGSVAVIPGGPDGPTGAGSQVFHQDTAEVPGAAEKGDAFGSALDLVDGNGDGRAEPVVGAYGENSGTGAVWVFPATASGATATGSFVFGPGSLGMPTDQGWLGHNFPS
ncbi:FG-GAP and VCBS repeat-containing protein [Streptomyces sp. CRN 30]|uniref:VCBS repeat-containing protein n=1 Tax=Streptomyces sp. CRN 30 TaxID=3075613 RepID=UPI002A7F33FE|nr:FG-GAP and VCBS repeat-containing protein [Streptomyces sp. CRN 30]